VTVGINWLVKPFSMAALGWLFIGWLFRPWLPAGRIDSYIAGLILLAAVPCTAVNRRVAARPVIDHRAVGRRYSFPSSSTLLCLCR
jgi:hypothetical protein